MKKKSTKYRLEELQLSLENIEYSIKHFQETKKNSYLLSVIAQLRALVCFNPNQDPKKKANLAPLLLDMAEKSEVELNLYSKKPKPEQGAKGLAASIIASKTWSVTPQTNYIKYTLRDWMTSLAFHLDTSNTFHSRNEIVRQLADKNAVHYDEDVGLIVDNLKRISGSRCNGFQLFVLDCSPAVLYLGLRFIQLQKLMADGVSNPETHTSIVDLDQGFDSIVISLM